MPARASTICKDALKKVFAGKIGKLHSEYDLIQFRNDLDKTNMPNWKKKLVYEIWKKEVEQGIMPFDLRSYSLRNRPLDTELKRAPLPYVLHVPREIANGIIAVAKSEGIKPAQRYIVIPAKTLVTIGVRSFYSNVFMVLALGGTGAILDVMNLNVSNPLLDESDPTELEENEVIVIVKLDTFKNPEENYPMYLDGGLIETIKKESPDKIIVIDLSSDSDSITDNIELRVTDILKNELKGKKIKKLIVSGHGTPGRIQGDLLGDVPLNKLLEILQPLRSELQRNSEVHFTSCLLAGNENGRAEVRHFADSMLPIGGKIVVNKLLGYANGNINFEGSLAKNSTSSGFTKTVTLLNPVLGESIATIPRSFWYLIKRQSDLNLEVKRHEVDKSVFENPKYEYSVTKTPRD